MTNSKTKSIAELINALPANFAQLPGVFDRMAAQAVAAINLNRPTDSTFGPLSILAAFVGSVSGYEGRLLETGVKHLLETSGAFTLLEGVKLPLTPAALEVVKSQGRKNLPSMRLDSEVHAYGTYKPDLVFLSGSGTLHLMEIKRATANISSTLGHLLDKMAIASITAHDHIWRHHGRPNVTAISTLLVDASCSDRLSKEVVYLSDLDTNLGVPGLSDAMLLLRAYYAKHVQLRMRTLLADTGGAIPRHPDNLHNQDNLHKLETLIPLGEREQTADTTVVPDMAPPPFRELRISALRSTGAGA